MSTPSLDMARLWASIEEAGRVGRERDGSVRRLALSRADASMRTLLVGWGTDHGFSVRIDRIGNIFVRREGTDSELPPVVVGSHLDTQVVGGRYDGALGVLAGLEVLRSFEDAGVATRRAVEVACWTNEEGARFLPPMMGSRAFARPDDVESLLRASDEDGTTVASALSEHDLAGDAEVGRRDLDCYFELHIEQGPELDRAGRDVGIVTGGFAAQLMQIGIIGVTGHAGPTALPDRRDAIFGGALVIEAVREVAQRHGPDARGGVNRIIPWPNRPGIISSRAEMTADLRHPSPDVLVTMVEDLSQRLKEAEREAQVEIRLRESVAFGGLEFDADCVAALEQAAADRGHESRRMLSQAGHDAYLLAEVTPTAMVFCPCVDGVSHNEREDVDPARVAPAVETLLGAVLARACR